MKKSYEKIFYYLILIGLLFSNLKLNQNWHKKNKKSNQDPYKIENMIITLSNFKRFITCKDKIYIYIKEPPNIVHSSFAMNYIFSPCNVHYKGEEVLQLNEGFTLINRLHPNFDYYKDLEVFSNDEFKLLKNYK